MKPCKMPRLAYRTIRTEKNTISKEIVLVLRESFYNSSEFIIMRLENAKQISEKKWNITDKENFDKENTKHEK